MVYNNSVPVGASASMVFTGLVSLSYCGSHVILHCHTEERVPEKTHKNNPILTGSHGHNRSISINNVVTEDDVYRNIWANLHILINDLYFLLFLSIFVSHTFYSVIDRNILSTIDFLIWQHYSIDFVDSWSVVSHSSLSWQVVPSPCWRNSLRQTLPALGYSAPTDTQLCWGAVFRR